MTPDEDSFANGLYHLLWRNLGSGTTDLILGDGSWPHGMDVGDLIKNEDAST